MPQLVPKSVNDATEYELVEAERQQIEQALCENAHAIARCDAPTAMSVNGTGRRTVQMTRPSARRAALLKEQRRLVMRRSEIYTRWAELKGESQ
jgi:hypothetical protein